jgi:site-specific recombinase XerD
MRTQISGLNEGKESFADLIPFPAPPPKFSPATAYLSRLAPSSRLTMTKLLQRLVELLGSSTPAEGFPWAHLDYATTLQLRQALVSRYAPATANLALSALRGVLREAWRLGDMSYETFRRVSDLAHVRGDRLRPRRSVDTRSIDRLLTVTRNDETLRGRRDLAMLSVLYGSGLRRSELIHLDLAHIAEERLMVFGKGQQWRTAYLGEEAAAALERWLELRGAEPGALFFPIHRSGVLLSRRLSTEAIARIVARRAHAAGVGELRPHDLRRAFATRLLERGVDVLLVQRILGHRSVATTELYDCRIDRVSHASALA